MDDLISINSFPVREVLNKLLSDKSTGRNIIFATDTYRFYLGEYSDKDQMTSEALRGFGTAKIQPRVRKAQEQQSERTRKKAEVFTPTWIVKKMNDECEKDWQSMLGDDWKKTVLLRVLEITCGEAPFLVTRYDTTTGDALPISQRVGMLDRKLRLVCENAKDEAEWLEWAVKAMESTYGYEYQGDNLLIGRINLLITFCDYMQEHLKRQPTKSELSKITNIIAWNIWQMDGLKDAVPLGMPGEDDYAYSLFGEESNEKPHEEVACRICNWRHKRPLLFKDIKEGKTKMKFDYVIGNPPYQETSSGDKPADDSVYHFFMDSSYSVSNKVLLITPARFLFDAGNTPKAWRTNILNDTHIKVLDYESDSKKIFNNVDIKGGVAITYRSADQCFEPINTFIPFKELRSIVSKTAALKQKSLSEIIYAQNKFVLKELYKDYPELQKLISSNGKEKRMTSGCFEKLTCFKEKKESDMIQILGLIKNKRFYRWIDKKYMELDHPNLFNYKVILPANNGSGELGEVLSTPVIGNPQVGYTQTFIGIGSFENDKEAENALKYIKTKYCRIMLGILKKTQNGKKETWRKVPLQDFTENSDIDWSVSIPEIDRQLYKKYGLSEEEIDFIETHVKEMV